ncbi:hypothetical protein [Commensalibacter papalotli (ex Botero et al. 2024)]|uniref:hypothetical protein n=1 Tax=Commensalibacter papalotli (ex Botero et al. 2024) TaxID=2972766 RepID=UPI0022FF666F|nr:hypothetical protein [Commensalibacter papalotli (ex Botero et al. 2024)]CAI3945725.1 unnamed protein product [Commensalibacter papalotli (ex Botero et al. 2024)]
MDLIISDHSVPLEKADRAPKKVIDQTPQYATDGDPAQGIPATILTAAHYNSLTAEVTNAILAGGKKLDKNDWSQLASIIKDFITELGKKIDNKTLNEKLAGLNINIDLSPYYKKTGDTLTGAMHTGGQSLWGSDDKTQLIGKGDGWYIKNDKNVTLISFENGSIILNGQYSSFSGYAITVNTATIQDNNVTIQSNNTVADGNGFIHGNGIHFDLQKRGVNGNIYLQEQPGIETALVFQVSGGGQTSSMGFNNAGLLSVIQIRTDNIKTSNIDVEKSIKVNTIKNNGADSITFDSPVMAKGSFQVNDNDLYLKSDNPRPDTGQYRNTNSVIWQFDEDQTMRGMAYFQEHVGVSNNLVFLISGGENTYNYTFDNLGTFSCKYINASYIQTNHATIQDNNVTIQSNNTVADGNGFIHGNGIHFDLQKRGVNGNIYLQEKPGIETALVFQVSGGGQTSSMGFNNAGDLGVNSITTSQITSYGNLNFNVTNGSDSYNYSLNEKGTIVAKYFTGVAAEANYADLAEYYRSDQLYDPGTIVKIGGEQEITTACKGGFFLGIVSTNPAFLMNTSIKNENLALPVALAGRVPVKIMGEIKKGDPITLSKIDGIATKANQSENIIGFSLEDSFDQKIRLVECSIKSVGNC